MNITVCRYHNRSPSIHWLSYSSLATTEAPGTAVWITEEGEWVITGVLEMHLHEPAHEPGSWYTHTHTCAHYKPPPSHPHKLYHLTPSPRKLPCTSTILTNYVPPSHSHKPPPHTTTLTPSHHHNHTPLP